MKLKMLLLQARYPDDPCRPEERESFARSFRVPVSWIETHDLLDNVPSIETATSFDVLLMGGSGDFSVSQNDLPTFPALFDLLHEVTERNQPVFASCFGFHCLVEALGGSIVYDPGNAEVGTFPVELTNAGKSDQLLQILPRVFNAQLGHKDRADRLPEGAICLARSPRCPVQAFRLSEKPIWALQFHPELDRETNRGRFLNYLKNYSHALTPEELHQVDERFEESRETMLLPPQFLRVVFGYQPAG